MNRKTYWKMSESLSLVLKDGWFLLLHSLALGSFALVGLKVTTPDMQHTGTSYFTKTPKTADLTVTGSYGLNQSDQDLLNQVSSEANIEYGYFKDEVLKDSTDAFDYFKTKRYLNL